MALPSCKDFFQIIDHTADIAIAVHALSKEELLNSSIRAMFCIMEVEGTYEEVFLRKISIPGLKFEEIIVNLLNRILLILETESFIVTKGKNIKIKGSEVSLGLYGHPIKEEDIHGEIIKAVTYHNLSYSENPFSIQITMDL